MVSSSYLDTERLSVERKSLKDRFDSGAPFRHVVVDGFLERTIADRAFVEFPRLDRIQRSLARLLEARSFFGGYRSYGTFFEGLFGELQGAAFTSWLRELTGIEDLEMDPELVGGGFHQGARGSNLHIHADHNTHPNDPTRYRRINVLVYANECWDPSWGGDLELFDERGETLVSRIAPAFNRAVIMDVHDHAYHGYRALRVPADVTRKTLAAYYYSASPGPNKRPKPIRRCSRAARATFSKIRCRACVARSCTHCPASTVCARRRIR